MCVSIRGFQFFHIWAIISKFGKLTVEKLTEHDGNTASRNGQLHMFCLIPGSFLCFDRRSRRQLVSLLSVITFQKRECSRNGSSDDAMNKGNFLYILIMHETRHVRTQSNIG